MAKRTLMPWRRRETKVPVRREEEQPLALWQRDLDAMFDEFYRGFGLAPFRNFGLSSDAFSPKIDVVDGETELKVRAELPGMDAEDVDVSVTQDVLTIRGEKREESEDRGKDYYRVERSFGSFSRSVQLPCEVDPGEADATFEKGVITITLPKTRTAECRTIEVRAK
jgi:HSP20 family protein